MELEGRLIEQGSGVFYQCVPLTGERLEAEIFYQCFPLIEDRLEAEIF